jgi:Protein of unknown function (DUF1488)
MPLVFQAGEPYFEPVEKMLCWFGSDGTRMVACKVTCSAIDDLYRATDLTEGDRRVIFNRHRNIFEAVASKKYDSHLRTQQGAVVVETSDIADHHGKFGEYRRPMPGKFV